MSNYLFTNPKNNRRFVFMIQITNISETYIIARFLPNRKISYCTRIKKLLKIRMSIIRLTHARPTKYFLQLIERPHFPFDCVLSKSKYP